jgi:hypothetical protein
MKKLLWWSCVLWISACEKNIDFTLHESPAKLVVEAQIENDKAPMVVLTKSQSYFEQISPNIAAVTGVNSLGLATTQNNK